MPLQKSRTTFLLLPLELRLQIYEYIFLCKKQIILYKTRKHWIEHPIPPSILRTCKQIHQEASPILYSKNIFSISYPERISKWLLEIGRANIKLLKTIHIWVDPPLIAAGAARYNAKETAFWYKVLDLLAREATGLRHIEIHWCISIIQVGGYGKDLRFVRELAKIQGLESMVVSGHYGVHWPRYLTKKMGVEVVEKEDPDESWPRARWVRRMFQEDTEDLIP